MGEDTPDVTRLLKLNCDEGGNAVCCVGIEVEEEIICFEDDCDGFNDCFDEDLASFETFASFFFL
jgi:hypothetical protein